MIYPENIEKKIGFDVIRQQLIGYCFSELGKKLIEELSFETDLDLIELQLERVNDLRELVATGEIPPISATVDLSAYLARSLVKDNWLNADELYYIYASITTSLGLKDFIRVAGKEYSSLTSLVPELVNLSALEVQLVKSIDEDGNVLSSASSELKNIRGEILEEEGSLRNTLSSIFRKASADGFVPDGASIGVRDGRMVIPIIASHKRKIQGFIHDESASGNIVFLEPTVALSSNNRVRELHIAESREIRKILIELTSRIRENHLELASANIFLAEFDSLWARVKLAKVLDAAKPQISSSEMNLVELRHPLLILSYLDSNRVVIAQDFNLAMSSRLIIISGPNAGGKSVAMKSVALNQFMLQSGILPCCTVDSKFKVFKSLFIDIGDEQSIDNDLSTYSSHLKNMSVMLGNVDVDSFIFIDEFGSGTDPTFGGAMAEAVLGELVKRKCFGLITTHFSNLKVYADKTSEIVNAAMLFDIDRLLPLYQIEMGRPGSSFTLEVALKSGLPKDVIKKAEEGIGVSQVDIEKLLNNLELEKQHYAEQNLMLAEMEDEITRLRNEYRDSKSKLEDGKKEILNKAKEEAEVILTRTNREIEKTIRHIKENRAEKKETKKVRESLKEFSKKVTAKEPLTKKEPVTPIAGPLGPLKEGDQALLIDRDVVVSVIEIKGKKAKVLIGELQSVIAISKLSKISNRKVKEKRKHLPQSAIAQKVNDKMANFSTSLDVRGTRAADLLPKLDQFLDEAIMLNQTGLKIIHGRGNGVLRKLVHEELKQWGQVSHFESENEERGGDGATLITLK